MTNQEIDHKLAEAMGYRIGKSSLDGVIRVYKDKTNKVPRYFRPHRNMSDAWDVAEHFGTLGLAIEKTVHSKLHPERERYTAYIGLSSAVAETAPMAICLAALRVIETRERSKSDE